MAMDSNTWTSITKALQARAVDTFGLASADDIFFEPHPEGDLPEKSITVLDLRTIQDGEKAPFGNLAPENGARAERFLTVVDIEAKTSGSRYRQAVDDLASKVAAYLAGPGRGGLVLPRYSWANPAVPVVAGQLRFVFQRDDPLDDPEAPEIKSRHLTYEVHWTRPF